MGLFKLIYGSTFSWSFLEVFFIKSLKFKDYELFFEINSYQSNNRLAVFCYTKDEPFSDVTVNLPNTYISSYDEGFIDPINKDVGLYQSLIDKGIIKEVIKENVTYNMEQYSLVKFDMDKLKEYDPKGFEEYIKSINYSKDVSSPSI